MGKIEDRLRELGFELKEAPKPAAAYVPAVSEDNLVFTAGQIPFVDGAVKYCGKVGKDLTLEEAYAAAQVCVLNCLSVVKQQIGDLDKIKRVLKVNGYVNSVPEFKQQHLVINGASELLQKVFGDGRGLHARTAVGVNVLPFDAAVEVEMIVAL